MYFGCSIDSSNNALYVNGKWVNLIIRPIQPTQFRPLSNTWLHDAVIIGLLESFHENLQGSKDFSFYFLSDSMRLMVGLWRYIVLSLLYNWSLGS